MHFNRNIQFSPQIFKSDYLEQYLYNKQRTSDSQPQMEVGEIIRDMVVINDTNPTVTR